MRMMFEQDGPLSYDGRWISFDDVLFEPKPSHPIPLLVGGNHAKALRRAALLGDGWHPLFLGPEDYARGRGEIERIRREEGIARPFTFSLSGPQTRILASGGSAGRSKVAQEGTSYAPPVGTDEQGRQRFVGTAEQVLVDCLEMAGAGVEQLVLRFAVPVDPEVDLDLHLQQLRLFASEVLPHCGDA
jgi:alkanesulfonate monooxygenase SsuD/methylene tetrahydromethanopterin reductase-like flavin-dependent oxidoreductase (luciferase family)